MSISNTLGANTLDILLSLGVPWFVKCSISAWSSQYDTAAIYLTTENLEFNFVGLISSTIILNIIAVINRYKMNRTFGLFCLCSYFIISTLFILMGLGIVSIFGISNKSC